MEVKNKLILCFGTFARTLKYCKPSVGDVADTKLVGTMTRTVDPDCGYINDTAGVSKLLSCTQNLSAGDNRAKDDEGYFAPKSNVIQKALEIDTVEKKENVVLKFKETVIHFFDEDKKKSAILALLDIIRCDTSLNTSQKYKFEKCLGATKEELLSQEEYNFPDLLARIFLYTVTAINNKYEKEANFVKLITLDYVNQFNNPSYFWDSNSQTLKKVTSMMREIFEQLTNNYDIAGYMFGEPTRSFEIIELLEAIRLNILDAFVQNKDKVIYSEIQEFSNALESYNITSIIRLL